MPGSGDNAVLSLLWVILCVVVIIGLAYWVTRFVGGLNGPAALGAARGTAQMTVLARMNVGKDQSLLLVRVEQRYFLLGATPGGITTLAEFTPDEAAAWTSKAEHPENGQSMSFGKALQTVIERKKQR